MRISINHFKFAVLWVLMVLISMESMAASSPGDLNTFKPKLERGNTVVPARWLRQWDPVTVFFKSKQGPRNPGPAMDIEGIASLSPEHAGGWRWLNDHTLQFTPAEPWPPFSSYEVTAAGKGFTLHSLLPGPVETFPVHGSHDVAPVDTIKLVFPLSVEPSKLAEHTTISLWYGASAGKSPDKQLNHDHFTIKPIHGSRNQNEVEYALTLWKPIPASTRVNVDIDLTPVSGADNRQFTLEFTTARAFSILSLGAGEAWLPVPVNSDSSQEYDPLEIDVNPPEINIRFSAPPREVTPGALYDLLHLTPEISNLGFKLNDRIVTVTGDFVPDTVYTATLRPTPLLVNAMGQTMEMSGTVSIPLVMRKPAAMLQWDTGNAIIERYGPKMLPVTGRGNQVAELRLYRIDPLDKTLWPFPASGVVTQPDKEPPTVFSDNEYHEQADYVSEWQLVRTLNTMGSPLVTELVTLPMKPMGKAGTYGLDIEKYLTRIDGEHSPGTYLAAIQSLENPRERHWMRFQVTDLAVTTVNEPDQATFLVTSLGSAEPLANSRVTVEGYQYNDWKRIFTGKTNAMGTVTLNLDTPKSYYQVRRIRVERGNDQVLFDTYNPPQVYRNGYWSQEGDWLYSVINHPASGHRNRLISHIFTERPMVKPGEPVHIRGWLRQRNKGELQIPKGKISVTVEGPGGLNWSETVPLSKNGGFYMKFHEESAPAGRYSARINLGRKYAGECSFNMEDYRIPTFEVRLHSDDTVPLDAPFDVGLTATYYAGGVMTKQPVDWRVTQHPFKWKNAGLPGFRFADDDQFSGRPGLRDDKVLTRRNETDDTGADHIQVNPLDNPSLQTRTYVVEATVTGADNQSVTAVKKINALPRAIVGLKSPRIIKPGHELKSQIVVVDAENQFLENIETRVRLKHRTWHTVLKSGNYGAGDLQYDTHQVDTVVEDRQIVSGTSPVSVTFSNLDTGVYIVEASIRDELGRAQVVAMDTFVQGDRAVAWERPGDRTFTARTNHDEYAPGETVEILLESPFQNAEAVAVVEAPDDLKLVHGSVRNGAGVIRFTVRKSWCPGVPVTVLLMRGRLPRSGLDVETGTDLGKPQTLGAHLQLNVSRESYEINVDLDYPEKALPGQTIELSLELSDENQRPLEGEVAVWLVDRAVLALGKEAELDPLEDLLKNWPSYAQIRDTREYTVGLLPGLESPGGGFGAAPVDAMSIFDRMSLRKKFQAVPFYEPFVNVDSSGKTKLTVELPDNLTQFAIRAKACSGEKRFGVGTGMIAVRLPLVIQPTLPRFLRFGDVFDAMAISRIVEGEAADGHVAVSVDTLTTTDDTVKTVSWLKGTPVPSIFTLAMPGWESTLRSDPGFTGVQVALAAERASDGIGDAVEITIPVDRYERLWKDSENKTLTAEESVELKAVDQNFIRPESAKRKVRVSISPVMNLAVSAESMLADYPFKCTEQRISQASGFIALTQLSEVIGNDASEIYQQRVQETIDYIPAVIDSDGLAGFWPGGKGYVYLTTRVARFLANARQAGYSVDPAVLNTLTAALEKSLRSNSDLLLNGFEMEERCLALEALFCMGNHQTAYLEEMARRVDGFGLEIRARIIRLLNEHQELETSQLEQLVNGLLEDVIIQTINGEPVATDLRQTVRREWIRYFMDDLSALAEVTRTVLAVHPDHPKINALLRGLSNRMLSRKMTTYQADSALTVIREYLETAVIDTEAVVQVGGREVILNSGKIMAVFEDSGLQPLTVKHFRGDMVTIQSEISGYRMQAPGDQPAETRGFAVNRQWTIMDDQGNVLRSVNLDSPGQTVTVNQGEIIEEHVQVVNADDWYYVAVQVPLAAGMEPMNPRLATASSLAEPAHQLTLSPVNMEMRDSYVAYYYNELPRGNYDFYFRTKAAFQGQFTVPGAAATMMYDLTQTGSSPGVRVEVTGGD